MGRQEEGRWEGRRREDGNEGRRKERQGKERVSTYYKRTERQRVRGLTLPLVWWASLTVTVHDPCELTKKHKSKFTSE